MANPKLRCGTFRDRPIYLVFGLDRMIAGYLSGAEGELISDCAAINIPSHETGPLKSSSVSLQASSGSERNFQSLRARASG